MTTPYTEPVVEILKAELFSGGSRITCRFNKPYSEPVAPGGLYTECDASSASFVVHRAIASQGEEVTFETFGVESQCLPPVGASFFFRAWWIRPAMDTALDTAAVWDHRTYPDNGDHHHCLFTWETIAAHAEQKAGWWSAKYGWITEKAYQDFIVNDRYHLRERQ